MTIICKYYDGKTPNTSVPLSDIEKIKQHNVDCFGNSSYINNSEYACLYKNNELAASLCFISRKYLSNVCTPTLNRKQGFQKKLFDFTLKEIYDRYNLNYVYLFTENDERGIIPKKVYRKMGWYFGGQDYFNDRQFMYHFPRTGMEKDNPIVFPSTCCSEKPNDSVHWISSMLSSVFNTQVQVYGEVFNAETMIANKDNQILTNHLYLMESDSDQKIIDKIVEKRDPNKRFFLLVYNPGKYTTTIQYPPPTPNNPVNSVYFNGF